MEPEWPIRIIAECTALTSVLAVTIVFFRREVAEKRFWRAKAVSYLENLGDITEVAGDFADETMP